MSSTDTFLGDIIKPAATRRAGLEELPILSMTMRDGLVDQADKFKKRVASADTSAYRVVERGQLVVGFPIDEGVLSFQRLYDSAIVSPAYEVWDLVDPDSVSRDFLERFLRSPQALSYYAAKLQGSTARRRSLPRDVFLALPVPLPPLGEQERIAAVLDHVDALRAKRREAISLLDDLDQSIFLDMFGDPSVNSRDFDAYELEALIAEGDRINYGVVQPGQHVEGGVPLIRSGDLGRLGVDRSSLMLISPDIESSYSRSRIKGNEILIGCVGAIGEVATVSAEDVGSNVARAVARVPIADDVDREYVAAYLRMDFVQRYFRRELRTVAQPTLNVRQIKSAPVVFPPSHLRSKFADRVRSVTRQRAVHITHLATLDELFTSLQHRAFSDTLWDHVATGDAA